MAVTPFCPHPAMQTLVANALSFLSFFLNSLLPEKRHLIKVWAPSLYYFYVCG